MLFLDIFVLHRKNPVMDVREAVRMTLIWVSVALAFGVLVFTSLGADRATEYYTAYTLEKMMSIDNLFVFIIIFAYFGIPEEYQHKALSYGVIGAVFMRLIFIVLGAALLEAFHPMMYVFAIIIIIAAVKTVLPEREGKDSLPVRLSKHIRSSPELDGDKLFTVRDGVRMATPLFLCILVVELSDLLFAVDSIPACLGVTTDIFVVYSSNIFAVMGLRALYFVLKGSLQSLAYLGYGVAAVLVFIGVKMLLCDFVEISAAVSLVVILIILGISAIASLGRVRRNKIYA